MKTFREELIEALEIGMHSHREVYHRAIMGKVLEDQFTLELLLMGKLIARLKQNEAVPLLSSDDDHDPRRFCRYPVPELNEGDE